MKKHEVGARCCGCSACVVICPKQCISMKTDAEGFWYPVVDDRHCINCSLCTKVCTVCQEDSSTDEEIKTYIGFNKNFSQRMKSSSGGLFYVFAKQILDRSGIVYGAAFNNDHSVSHVRVQSMEELDSVLTSKYVQSEVTSALKSVIVDLQEKKQVLFCGTPCQVSGLLNIAKHLRLEENLFTIDFVCHGVPSPLVWKFYVEYLRKLYGEIENIEFRNKDYGWHDFHLRVQFSNNKCFSESHELNAYMKSFLSNKNIRRSCYECPVKCKGYVSDLTLADAWKIEKEKPVWADDCGTSACFVRTDKGERLMDLVREELEMAVSDYEKQSKFNPSLICSTRKPNNRDEFFQECFEQSPENFWKSYGRVKLKKRIRYIAKKIIRIGNLDRLVRKYY